jgi:hypothetical protein
VANEVRAYADTVATALGGVGTPGVGELLAAADAVDLALGTPGTLTTALDKWGRVTDALQGRLVAFLLANVPIPDLPLLGSSDSWLAPEGVRLDANLGPLAVHVQSPPLQLADPRGDTPLTIGPLPVPCQNPSRGRPGPRPVVHAAR